MRALRALRSIRHAARFRLWAAGLRIRLRRAGGRLELDAPHGAHLTGVPDLQIISEGGGGGGTFTLRLGRDVRFGRHVTLEVHADGDSVLEIGDHSHIGHSCRLQVRRATIRIAQTTQIRDGVVLKSDGLLTIGSHTVLGYWTVVHCSGAIDIGDHVGIGERVSLIDSDHGFDGTDEPFLPRALRVGPIRIGRNVLVSVGAVILRDSDVGANSVVASNAVVNGGHLPAGWLIGGVPARPLRALPGAAPSG